MIYLASPYRHSDLAVQEARFQAVCKVAAKLMAQGHIIFSPIAHTHPIALAGDLPKDWGFWKRYDIEFLTASSEVWVLTLPGWDISEGVRAEMALAIKHRLVIRFLTPEGEFVEGCQP